MSYFVEGSPPPGFEGHPFEDRDEFAKNIVQTVRWRHLLDDLAAGAREDSATPEDIERIIEQRKTRLTDLIKQKFMVLPLISSIYTARSLDAWACECYLIDRRILDQASDSINKVFQTECEAGKQACQVLNPNFQPDRPMTQDELERLEKSYTRAIAIANLEYQKDIEASDAACWNKTLVLVDAALNARLRNTSQAAARALIPFVQQLKTRSDNSLYARIECRHHNNDLVAILTSHGQGERSREVGRGVGKWRPA